MSKANSNLFVGTEGHRAILGKENSEFINSRKSAEDIIAERVKGLDTKEHPIKNKKYLSNNQIKRIKEKIDSRTATMKEYKDMRMSERLNARRNEGRDSFWEFEKERILKGETPTRKWTETQIKDILAGRRPKYNGKTIQAHHTYNVSRYPHLANRWEVIFPTTFKEHFYDWHGGNWKNSLPGKRIRNNGGKHYDK